MFVCIIQLGGQPESSSSEGVANNDFLSSLNAYYNTVNGAANSAGIDTAGAWTTLTFLMASQAAQQQVPG